jgi:hypothetical protein
MTSVQKNTSPIACGSPVHRGWVGTTPAFFKKSTQDHIAKHEFAASHGLAPPILMDYVEGSTFFLVTQDMGPTMAKTSMDPDKRRALDKALQKMNELNLIHNDLHAGNMVFHQGRMYFIDWDDAFQLRGQLPLHHLGGFLRVELGLEGVTAPVAPVAPVALDALAHMNSVQCGVTFNEPAWLTHFDDVKHILGELIPKPVRKRKEEEEEEEDEEEEQEEEEGEEKRKKSPKPSKPSPKRQPSCRKKLFDF